MVATPRTLQAFRALTAMPKVAAQDFEDQYSTNLVLGLLVFFMIGVFACGGLCAIYAVRRNWIAVQGPRMQLEPTTPEVVYFTSKGECWHKQGCPSISMSKIVEQRRRCLVCASPSKAKTS